MTFDNSNAGAASGATFDGSAARTISTNTIGAQPLLTNPVTGPGSGATIGHIAVMGNTSGTSITDGGAAIPGLTNTLGCLDGYDHTPCVVATSGTTPNSPWAGLTAAQDSTTVYTTPNDSKTHIYQVNGFIIPTVAGVGTGYVAWGWNVYNPVGNNGDYGGGSNNLRTGAVTGTSGAGSFNDGAGASAGTFVSQPNKAIQLQMRANGTITTWPTYSVWWTITLMQ